MNKILESDFKYITNSNIPWDKMFGKTVFVTGGTGFLGSLLIHFFAYLNETHHWNISIITLVRDEKKAKKLFGNCCTIINGDIFHIPDIPTDIDFLFHCAAETDSKKMIETPVDVSEGIILGTCNIMKLASLKKVKSAVFLSSMEVYGDIDVANRKISEDECGVIDIMSIRSCYPMGKRMAENICINYYHQYGIPVKIARLAQIFGAGVRETDNRVFAQFARSVINKKNIILHTDGSSIGNYCYSADAILGLILILLKGTNGQAYNVVNEESTMTIKKMAELVADKIAEGSISVEYDVPENNIHGYAVTSKNRLSSEKLSLLGWKPMYGMEDMYRRMIGYLSDIEYNQNL